jgi:uncharacterized membrane protein
LELIMSTRSQAAAWLLSILVVGAAAWIVSTPSGAAGALAVVPIALSAILLAVAWHVTMSSRNARTRYLQQHRPLAGPRPGAHLPR